MLQHPAVVSPCRLRSAARARVLLAAAVLCIVAWSAPRVAAQVFCGESGLVVMQVESAPLAGSWAAETAVGGFTGSSYYRWAGANQFNSPGQGTLSYSFTVTTPGDYSLRLRNHHDHPDSTQENDCWTRLDGGTWVKTYSGTAGTWTWATRFEYADGFKENAHYELAAGSHVFQISGRSQDFRIDRVHLYLEGTPGATDSNQPQSPTGPCGAPRPHPAHVPTSLTAVFADGTLGGLQAAVGTPVVLPNPGGRPGQHLSFDGSERVVLPGVTYEDQEVLVRVRKGMPQGSWIGVLLRAPSEAADFAGPGPQTLVFMQREIGAGRAKVFVHDGAGIVAQGPWFDLAQLNVGADDVTFRVSTSGNSVDCTLSGLPALGGGFTGIDDPPGGGYTSLRTTINPAFPGTIGVDYCLLRRAGDLPDLRFDADGKLWISALETDLLLPGTWQPASFAFQHDAYLLDLASFLAIVFPALDYVGSDADHFVLGVVDSGLALPVGSSNVLQYKAQLEGAFQP